METQGILQKPQRFPGNHNVCKIPRVSHASYFTFLGIVRQHFANDVYSFIWPCYYKSHRILYITQTKEHLTCNILQVISKSFDDLLYKKRYISPVPIEELWRTVTSHDYGLLLIYVMYVSTTT